MVTRPATSVWRTALARLGDVLAVLIFLLPTRADAADCYPQKVTAQDGRIRDQFGGAVAVSGLRALIGTDLDAGERVHAFRREGFFWVEDVELLPLSPLEPDDRYGEKVAISGEVALVGAFLDDDAGPEAGSVYVFRHDGSSWSQEAKLIASDLLGGEAFGFAVGLSASADLAVVSSYQDATGAPAGGAAYVFRYDGSAWVEEVKLLPSVPVFAAHFGSSAAVSGDVVLIGAHSDHSTVEDSGAAYVFRHDGSSWSEEAKLLAPSPSPGEQFGASVSLSGDAALIGAPWDEGSVGAAHVFRHDGAAWVQEDTLTASDGEAGDRFGWSVSLDGDLALIGAPRDGSFVGAAYRFERDASTWSEVEKLVSEDPAAPHDFGDSVSVSGTVGLVGAPHDHDGSFLKGAAYFFDCGLGDPCAVADCDDGDACTEDSCDPLTGECVHDDVDCPSCSRQVLRPSDPADFDHFGASVSHSDGLALVGARRDDDAGESSGSAYLFRQGGWVWQEQTKLVASDGQQGDEFGRAVSLSGQVAVIGAALDDDNGLDSGSGYVFRDDGAGWAEEAKLLASDGVAGDQSGSSACIDGDLVVLGAPFHDAGRGAFSGAARVFRASGPAWSEEAKLVASDGAESDNFGWSVAVSGDVLLVGAPGTDDAGDDSGSAYVFRHDGATWIEEAELVASDANIRDYFGWSVSAAGEVLVIGARGAAFGRGEAYVFRHDGVNWVEEAILTGVEVQPGDEFGESVAIHGDIVVVGSAEGGPLPGSGAAYVFEHDGLVWSLRDRVALDEPVLDGFGTSVAATPNGALVGAPTHLGGAVHSFHCGLGDPCDPPEISHPGLDRDSGAFLVEKRFADLRLRWQASRHDVRIYVGTLDNLRGPVGYDHAASAACEQTGTGMIFSESLPESAYLLVVASACDPPSIDGPLGTSSDGVPRPSSASLGLASCP